MEEFIFDIDSELSTITMEYYKSVQEYLNDNLNNIYRNEIYGKDVQYLYDIGNDFHYLGLYLNMIYLEMNNDLLSSECGVDKGTDYYIDKYAIGCIRKHFYCNGYDVSPALEIYSLEPSMTELDGIAYMHIDFQSTDCELNRKINQVT